MIRSFKNFDSTTGWEEYVDPSKGWFLYVELPQFICLWFLEVQRDAPLAKLVVSKFVGYISEVKPRYLYFF